MSYTKPTIEEIEARRADLAPFDGWNERAFCQVCAWMGIPRTYLDLGSGTGAMVNCARKLSSDAYGVDLINGPEGHFIYHDLTRPLRLENGAHDNGLPDHLAQQFDLITCLEVAEHLPLEAHETLVDSIARHLRPKPTMDDESGYVLFSAAPPGQAGEHHIGNRSAVEWRSMFYDRGLSYREDYTRQIAHLFGYVTGAGIALAGCQSASVRYGDAMSSDLWHRTGGVWPLGVSCSVSWYDLGAIAHIIQFAGIKAVLEVGVEHGGLAAWFISYGRYTDLAYRGVDITLNALQTKLGVTEWGSFVERDAWSAEAVNDAGIWMDSHPGPCLIICDGGDKPKELHLYAPLLRAGDVMVGHDYRHEYGDAEIADVGAERVFDDWLDDTLLCMFVRRA